MARRLWHTEATRMISILTPSRGRPEVARRMVESALKNPGAEIEIKFWLTEDDPDLVRYQEFLTPDQYTIGAHQSTSFSWNLMAESAQHDILFLVGDDATFTTDRWAVHIQQAFAQYPDRIACVYPRVPSLSRHKSPHFCLHRNWVNALGYFLPPHFHHWYVDTWIAEVARELGRLHCIEAFELPIEHIKDTVNREYHNSWMRAKDDWMWTHTRRHRERDIETLKLAMRAFNGGTGTGVGTGNL